VNAPACRSKWKVEPLGQAVDILDSRRVPVNSEERKKRVGKIPYYGATGQVGWINDYLFDEELVLLGEDGAPFLDSSKPKAYLIRGKSWVNNHAHVLRAKPGLLNSFLLYQLNCTDYGPHVSGTTRLKLPQGPMKQIPLAIPDEEEQREIVAEIEKQFTRLEAGVAGLRRVQANLKRYRAAVLKAACEGKLIPTEAELARQEGCTYETGAQLLARILTERRQKWNGKGKYKEPTRPNPTTDEDLPDGWTWASWEQVAFSQNGRPFPSTQYAEKGFKLLRPGNLSVSGKVVWNEDNTRYLPHRFADENPDLIVRGRELIMNLTAQSLKDEFLGRVCLTSEREECLLNQRLARLSPVVIPPEFALYLLKAWRFRRFVDGLNSGSLIQHMFTSQLAEFTFPLPPLPEQQRIVAELERRLSVLEELEAVVNTNFQRATRLRQSILQWAFNGEL